MQQGRLELADVFREHGGRYLAENGISVDQRRVLRAITVCRTAALGGHVKKCDRCGHKEFFYKSCDNRHCPKCQGSRRAKWLDTRASEVLQTRYFHIVFTLPHKLGLIALKNKRVVYGILFRAASEALLTLAKDPKHLGAEIGFLAVLHTWGQKLDFHPHVHCVVPGGGLSSDGKKWISSRKNFFIHVKVLSRVFRGKFIDYLKRALRKGELSLEGKLEHLKEHENLEVFLKSIKKKDWVVYAKRPFGGPTQTLKYLARYTHRVAISNGRLVSMKDDKVTFSWKDYAHGNSKRKMTLKASEFIRRFLLHVVPSRFQRIRYYGFLSNRQRDQKIKLLRALLGQREDMEDTTAQERPSADEDFCEKQNSDSDLCPSCGKGHLVFFEQLKPDRRPIEILLAAKTNDTS